MTDTGTPGEPGSLSGELEPSEPGEWLTLEEAGARLGIDRKAVYRRIRRGRMLGKKAPHASHLLVWMPREPGSPDEEHSERSLPVPAQGERFLDMLDRATAALGRQIQHLTEERDRARREHAEERERATAAEAELARLRALAARPWWQKILGSAP